MERTAKQDEVIVIQDDFEEEVTVQPRNKQDYQSAYCSYLTSYNKSMEINLNFSEVWDKHGFVRYQCNQCSYSASTKTYLNMHVLDCIGVNPNRYQCAHCHFKCKDSQSLASHAKQHIGKFDCSVCLYSTSTYSLLLKHVTSIHDKNQVAMTYKCDICKKSFIGKLNLAMHMKKIHSDDTERILKCVKCNFKTRRQTALGVHVLNHSAYACKQCPHRTAEKKALRTHMEQHQRKVVPVAEVPTVVISDSPEIVSKPNGLEVLPSEKNDVEVLDDIKFAVNDDQLEIVPDECVIFNSLDFL